MRSSVLLRLEPAAPIAFFFTRNLELKCLFEFALSFTSFPIWPQAFVQINLCLIDSLIRPVILSVANVIKQ